MPWSSSASRGDRVIKLPAICAPSSRQRLLLLRQRAEIKAVSVGDSLWRFSGSLFSPIFPVIFIMTRKERKQKKHLFFNAPADTRGGRIPDRNPMCYRRSSYQRWSPEGAMITEVITVGLFVLYRRHNVKLRHTAGGKFMLRGTESGSATCYSYVHISTDSWLEVVFFYFCQSWCAQFQKVTAGKMSMLGCKLRKQSYSWVIIPQ